MAGVDYVAPWFRLPYSGFDFEDRTLPFELWQALSPHAQAVTSLVVAPEGTRVPGAGVVHPDPEELQRIRAAEKERVKAVQRRASRL